MVEIEMIGWGWVVMEDELDDVIGWRIKGRRYGREDLRLKVVANKKFVTTIVSREDEFYTVIEDCCHSYFVFEELVSDVLGYIGPDKERGV